MIYLEISWAYQLGKEALDLLNHLKLLYQFFEDHLFDW